jgi:hypothetical protein
MNSLPLKTIRFFIAKTCPYHISQNAIHELKRFLEDLSEQIAKMAVQEFKELNNRRKKLGLPELHRLNEWSVQRACKNILKPSEDNNKGLQSRKIVGPGGKKNA